jgi:hypothetical protein
VNRKESDVAHVHHVGLLAAITDEELKVKLSKVEMANGFGNRILWAAVRRPRIIAEPQRIEDIVTTEQVDKLRDALDKMKHGRGHVWTPAARDLWRDWYTNIPPRIGLTGTLLGRDAAQVVRLALIYGLLDGVEREIDVQHLQASIALWEYVERSVAYIFGASTGNEDADAILAALSKVGDKAAWDGLKRDLGIRTAVGMQVAVNLLVRLGKVRLDEVRREGGGRARRDITRVAP